MEIKKKSFKKSTFHNYLGILSKTFYTRLKHIVKKNFRYFYTTSVKLLYYSLFKSFKSRL